MKASRNDLPTRVAAFANRRRSLVVALVLAGGLSAFWLYSPIMQFALAGRSRVGMVLADTSPVTTMTGLVIPRYSRDSATFLAFLDAGCAKCRLDAREYVRFAHWIEARGIAARLQLNNGSRGAAQFARLAGGDEAFVLTPAESYGRNGVLFVPTMLLVDTRGRILKRWASDLPSPEETRRLLPASGQP